MDQKIDVESLLERPELQWVFIRNVYSILAIQLLIIIAVADVVIAVEPISVFLTTNHTGSVLYFVLVFIGFTALGLLVYHYKRHPLNYFLLAISTIAPAFVSGLAYAFTYRKIIFEAAILPAGLVASLTLYAFWAARRGHYFDFQWHFWSSVTMVFIISLVIQIIFFEFSPLGQISYMSSVFVLQSYPVCMLHMIHTT